MSSTELSDLERQVLDLEGLWWRHGDAKTQAVKDQFGLTRNRYEQLVQTIIDKPEALEHAPMTVKRLQRLRAERRRARRGA